MVVMAIYIPERLPNRARIAIIIEETVGTIPKVKMELANDMNQLLFSNEFILGFSKKKNGLPYGVNGFLQDAKGRSMAGLGSENQRGPFSVMYAQSSNRIPNSP